MIPFVKSKKLIVIIIHINIQNQMFCIIQRKIYVKSDNDYYFITIITKKW